MAKFKHLKRKKFRQHRRRSYGHNTFMGMLSTISECFTFSSPT